MKSISRSANLKQKASPEGLAKRLILLVGAPGFELGTPLRRSGRKRPPNFLRSEQVPEFRIKGVVTVSCWTVVEAEDSAAALRIASNRDMATHHIDGSQDETECWNFDNDGEPQDLSVEPAE